MTKFLNISTDTTLGGNTPSDELVVSQKAISAVFATKQDTLVSGTNIKTVNGVSILGTGDITISSSVNWGYIGGTLADQTDLKNALDAKQDVISNLATIESGAAAGATAVQPGDLATVATTGSYNDLTDKPSVDSFTPGMIIMYGADSVPSGFLACDGSAVSRTTYANLFNVIGTTYGGGDGSTTFNLPNFTSRVPQGGTPGSYLNAGLPNISGNVTWSAVSGTYQDGCFYVNSNGSHSHKLGSGGNFPTGTINFNAANSNGIYGASSTVQPPALCTKFCIKY